jgi:hypothetical protein
MNMASIYASIGTGRRSKPHTRSSLRKELLQWGGGVLALYPGASIVDRALDDYAWMSRRRNLVVSAVASDLLGDAQRWV